MVRYSGMFVGGGESVEGRRKKEGGEGIVACFIRFSVRRREGTVHER